MSDKRIMHLTFDGAPHAPRTQMLLDVCRKFKVKATFFLEGHRLEKDPETVKQILAEGHSIGNHSYSHRDLLELPLEECIMEIEKTDELIDNDLHTRTCLVRPPNGHISPEFADYLEQKGKRVSIWNISVKDWTGPDAEGLAERTISLLGAPEITMVFHDFVEWNPEALEKIIPAALEMGYVFEALPME